MDIPTTQKSVGGQVRGLWARLTARVTRVLTMYSDEVEMWFLGEKGGSESFELIPNDAEDGRDHDGRLVDPRRDQIKANAAG